MSQAHHENRRSVRKPHKTRAMVELCGSCSLAQITTVSLHGLGLTTDLHSLPRRFDVVSLRFRNGTGDLIVHGDVRWSSAKRGVMSAFGVELREPGRDYVSFYEALTG